MTLREINKCGVRLMADENFREVYKQLITSQDKYTYFLLAAAGAAIALAVNRTQSSSLSWSQFPLAAAVLCWSLSFFFGCRQLAHVGSALYANVELLRVESGEHPKVGMNPQMMSAASEGIRQTIEVHNKGANRLSRMQFRFLTTGAAFYIAWHILEMWFRTASPAIVLPMNISAIPLCHQVV